MNTPSLASTRILIVGLDTEAEIAHLQHNLEGKGFHHGHIQHYRTTQSASMAMKSGHPPHILILAPGTPLLLANEAEQHHVPYVLLGNNKEELKAEAMARGLTPLLMASSQPPFTGLSGLWQVYLAHKRHPRLVVATTEEKAAA